MCRYTYRGKHILAIRTYTHLPFCKGLECAEFKQGPFCSGGFAYEDAEVSVP